jgi:hypothetical protein
MKMEDGVYTVHAELLNNTNDVVRKFNASPLDIQQHKSEYTISLTN